MARNGSSLTNLVSDIVDNVKDFVDDEVVERTKGTERDLRSAARNATDCGEDAPARTRRDEVSDLAAAVAALTAKVDALAKS